MKRKAAPWCRFRPHRPRRTPQDLAYSRGKLYERQKKKSGTNRYNSKPESKGAQNAHPKPEGKTADEVADDSGVDQATVRRDAEYSRAVDALTEVSGRDFEADYVGRKRRSSPWWRPVISGFEADYAGRKLAGLSGKGGQLTVFRGRLCGAHRSFQRRKVAHMWAIAIATCHLFDAPGGCR